MHIDTRTVKLIQNQLRQTSIIWHIRNEVLAESKYRVKIGQYKNGKDKYKVKHKCAGCEKGFNVEDVEVDHIVEVSKGLPTPSKMTEETLILWIKALFCDKDNLQVLCKGCHANKTMRFRGGKAKGLRGRSSRGNY